MKQAIAILVLVLSAAPAARAQWVEIGASATGKGLSTPPADVTSYQFGKNPSVAVDAQGRVYVAWQAGSSKSDIYLKWWDGHQWGELGGSATGAGLSNNSQNQSEQPVLALDSQGRPVVAWKEYLAQVGDIYVKRWNGTAWVAYGSASATGAVMNTPQESESPALALDAADRPIVAWEETPASSTKPEIWVKAWNGSAWIERGGASATGGGISASAGMYSVFPSIAVGPSGQVAVAWVEGASIHLKEWSPLQPALWSELGGSATGSGLSFDADGHATTIAQAPAVTYHSSGVPGVAWAATKFNSALAVTCSDVFFRYYAKVPQVWVGLGGSDAPGGISNSAADSTSVAMTQEASGNPVIAWREGPTDAASPIHLKHWTGAAWQEIAGSASGEGVSGGGDTHHTAIAMGPGDRPYVTWTSDPPPYPQVYLKDLNGAATASGPAQLHADGVTLINPGAQILERTFVAAAATSLDPEGHDSMLEVEVVELGQDFGGPATAVSAPTPSGGIAAVAVTGLAREKAYRWRLRLVDLFGAASPWIVFGGDPLAADFSIRANSTPVTALVDLRDADDGHVLAIGERFFSERGLRVGGTLSDADGDAAGIEVEARFLGEEFTGVPVAVSPLRTGDSGVAFDVALPDGTYHLRIRGVDALGEGSPWIVFGGNDESAPDFTLINPGGSIGVGLESVTCSGGAAPAGLLLLLIFLIFATGPSRAA